MAKIRRSDLLIISRILFTRLARPATISVDIIDHHLLKNEYSMNDVNINIASSFGRFVGCFDLTPSKGLCFYLAVRDHPDREISHIFVYYLNRNHKVIQYSEMETLKTYIVDLKKSNSNIKIGVVNVDCNIEHHNQLLLFVEAISYSVGPQMIENFQVLQIMDIKSDYTRSIPTEVSISQVKSQNCRLNRDSADSFCEVARQFGYKLNACVDYEKLDHPTVALIRSREHIIIIIYHEETRIVNYLLPHCFQFNDTAQIGQLDSLVNSFYDGNVSEHVYTRLYVDKTTKCDDKIVVAAFWLALKFKPHIFTSLKQREIVHIMQTERIKESLNASSEIYEVNNPSQTARDYFEASNIVTCGKTCLKLSCDLEYPQVLDDNFDSQATSIFDSDYLRLELSFWREICKGRQKIRDIIVPPIHDLQPFTDFTQSYLSLLPCYHNALKFMARFWSKYAKTIVSPIVEGILPELPKAASDSRFIIYPSRFINNLDYLLVVDTLKEEWIYLQPENAEHYDQSYFEDITKRYINNSYHKFSGFKSRSVFISNGKCHAEYSKLHLLMAMYVIVRLFRYSVELPKKIIYGEWELRRYANDICTELQLVNSQYNVDNNLVDSSGNLLEGAKESLPSPLRHETSVVPKDQCMFCLKRGFNNLGRHLSMKHGGQALSANLSRLEFD